jgi:hypothetical protein
MSCRGKVTHALGQCDCFKPGDYAALVENQRLWSELLMRIAQHRVDHPEGMDSGLINLMLNGRAHGLRN